MGRQQVFVICLSVKKKKGGFYDKHKGNYRSSGANPSENQQCVQSYQKDATWFNRKDFTCESIYGAPNKVSAMLHCSNSQTDIGPCIVEMLEYFGINSVQKCILTKQLTSLSISA